MLDDTPHRNCWAVTIASKEVKAALKEKLAFRHDRVVFWQNELERVKKDLSESGIKFETAYDAFGNATMQMYNNVLGSGVQVSIDPAKQKAVSEANNKITEHKHALRDLGTWSMFLDKMPDDRLLTLNKDDWYFFFDKP